MAPVEPEIRKEADERAAWDAANKAWAKWREHFDEYDAELERLVARNNKERLWGAVGNGGQVLHEYPGLRNFIAGGNNAGGAVIRDANGEWKPFEAVPEGEPLMPKVAFRYEAEQKLAAKRDSEKPNFEVYNGDAFFTVIAKEDLAKLEKEVSFLNRWAFRRGGGGRLSHHPTDKPVTNPYERWWAVSFVAGRAGWDAVPYNSAHREGVSKKYATEQSAYVQAPNALLAIERAKFFLVSYGKVKDK